MVQRILFIINILLIFLITFTLTLPSHADKDVFISQQFDRLESIVREKHEIEFIAKKLSQLRNYEEWTEEIDENLKLYIAIKWLEQNYINQSIKLLNQISSQENFQDLLMYYRSIALIHLGFAHKASGHLVNLEKKYPSDKDILYLKSIYLSDIGDLTGSIEILNKLIKKDKKNGKFYLQRGVMNLLVFSNDPALKDFKKAIKYLPKHYIYKRQQALLQAGLIYLRFKGDKDKAKAYLKRGIDVDPDSVLVKQVKQAMK